MSKFIPASEFCERIFDGTHDTPKPSETGKPLVTSKHIVGGRLDLKSAYLISDDDYAAVQKRSRVSQWDLLFSMIGTVGEVYLEASKEIPYAVKNVGVFSCRDEGKARWLYYFLRSPCAKDHIRRYLNGAVQKFLPLGALRDFPVLDYSLDKRRSVEILSALDAKIDLNNRINAELEALAKTIYDYWFVQFDFPDAHGRPYKSSGGAMVWNDTLKREIPAGWGGMTLGDFVTMERGVTYGKEDVRPFPDTGSCGVLRATNVSRNVVDANNLVYIDASKVASMQKISAFETLIVMSSGSKQHVGKNGVYYFNEKIAFGAFCSKISPCDERRWFVSTLLQSDRFKAYIGNQCLGTNINNLRNDHIRNFPVVKPAVSVAASFEAAAALLYKRISNNTNENTELTELRDWLLPLLMNGQVRVA